MGDRFLVLSTEESRKACWQGGFASTASRNVQGGPRAGLLSSVDFGA